ncbi:MAG TPA: cytochrome c3 family protein [Blastocatellia bacterium]|nr:cytochrome c3 family protein [Blastocatellia bacterium]
MNVKLAVLVVYALAVIAPSAPVARTASPHSGARAPLPQGDAKVFKLDERGKRGAVAFDHKAHEVRVNPDPRAPFQSKAGAACAGCHHTRSSFGVPQLSKCGTCHRAEGNKINPTNGDFDEVFAERAFHDSCIACHRASTKGPTTCNGCHQTVSRGR